MDEIKSRQVKTEFKERKTKQIAATVIFLPFLFGFFWFSENHQKSFFGMPENIAVPVFIALIVIITVFSFYNWRCPSCKKYLGKGYNPKFCPKCGVELR